MICQTSCATSLEMQLIRCDHAPLIRVRLTHRRRGMTAVPVSPQSSASEESKGTKEVEEAIRNRDI
jgi:hypothetical protein